MCTVSTTVKFCTCVSGSVDELEHYWVLYRFTKGTEKCIMIGTPVFPPVFPGPDEQRIETILLNRLNESEAFDLPIVFKPKDRLEIVLCNLSAEPAKRMAFTFKFKGKKWVVDGSDPFGQGGEYVEVGFGSIE